MESSLCETPERHASRRLSDHLTFEGQKQKVHSLVDKVYSRENLKLAWERVRANRGASGADKVTIGDFEANLDENLERLHRELRDQTYQPQAVRRLEIPKRGSPGKTRALGIPSVYDRICQQALANRLEPIFEKVFDPSSFGYRKGRKNSVLAQWFCARATDGRSGTRKTMLEALARQLLTALWRMATTGEIPEGVILRPLRPAA